VSWLITTAGQDQVGVVSSVTDQLTVTGELYQPLTGARRLDRTGVTFGGRPSSSEIGRARLLTLGTVACCCPWRDPAIAFNS